VRRLVRHAFAGVGFAAAVTAAAVAGLGSPAVESTAVAVPAVSASAPAGTPTAQPSVEDAAERAAREAEETRSATRARLVAASSQAGQRAAALELQSRDIAAQRSKIKSNQKAKAAAADKRQAEAKAAAAQAKAEALAAAEAAAQAVNEQGYEPGTNDPREIARQILKNKFSYGDDQYSCFNNIIIRESNWSVTAANPSGAYGIPQALPGSKMASVADDWRTNPVTQITWGIQYMNSRYGSPCQAWDFKRSHGWY
jgi:hypothetical protein